MRLAGRVILSLAASISLVAATVFFPVRALAQEELEDYNGAFKAGHWVFRATDTHLLRFQVNALTNRDLGYLKEISEDGAFKINVKSLTTASVEALPPDVRFDKQGAIAFGKVIQETANKIVEDKRQDELIPAKTGTQRLVISMTDKARKVRYLISFDMVRDTISLLGPPMWPWSDPTPIPVNSPIQTPTPEPGD